MSETNIDESSHDDDPDTRQSESRDFSAPLGKLKSGRLVFASGASRIRLKGNRMMGNLYRARFERYVPSVWTHEETLTLKYPSPPIFDHPLDWRLPQAEITLNGSIPWEIGFHNGVSQLKASLGELPLQSLDILGGANQIELTLGKPDGAAYIYVSGGIRNATIRRPAGVGLRVQVSGSISKLVFDDQHLEAASGEARLESPGFDRATSRYDLCIAGGASLLTIEQEK